MQYPYVYSRKKLCLSNPWEETLQNEQSFLLLMLTVLSGSIGSETRLLGVWITSRSLTIFVLGWAASPLNVSVSSPVKWVLTVVLSSSWGYGEDYIRIIHVNHLNLTLGYFAFSPPFSPEIKVQITSTSWLS